MAEARRPRPRVAGELVPCSMLLYMRAEVVERRRAVLFGCWRCGGRTLRAARRSARPPRASGVTERSVWRWLAAGGYEPGRAGRVADDGRRRSRRSTGSRAGDPRRRGGCCATRVCRCRHRRRSAGVGAGHLAGGARLRPRRGVGGPAALQPAYRRWEPAARNEVWETDHPSAGYQGSCRCAAAGWCGRG